MTARRAWFGEFAPRLERAGYEPLPIIPNQKRPPFNGWQMARPVASMLPAFRTYGIGILTKLNPALDVDVTNAALADDIQRLADRLLGEAPIRYGQRPKRLALYRLDGDPFPKLVLKWMLDDAEHKVEILACGQQALSHGPHPSGCLYEWERSPDLVTPRAWLPPLGGPTAIRFLKTLANILPRLDCVNIRATGWDLTPVGGNPGNVNASPGEYKHAGSAPPPWRRLSAREIAQRLDSKAHTEAGEGKWRCQCPAHKGASNNSLSIQEINGTLVWHCFADCSQGEVARALVEALG